MRPGQLLLQSLLALALLAGANLVVAGMSRSTVAGRLLERCRSSEGVTDLFLGNSLVAAAIDEDSFESASTPGTRALNAGCGSTGPLEHALVLLEAGAPRGGVIVYGFHDTLLTDPTSLGWRGLAGNRTLLFKVGVERAIRLAGGDAFADRLILHAVSFLPLLHERLAVWARVERARRALGGLGLPAAGVNRFGRRDDFGMLEPGDPESFERSLREAVAVGAPLSPPVTEIIDRGVLAGSRVVLVLMPMTRGHRRRFNASPAWMDYQAHLETLVRRRGADFIDALDWIDSGLFEDNLHLGREGAAAFSERLARALHPGRSQPPGTGRAEP